jgi:hypothetical protein
MTKGLKYTVVLISVLSMMGLAALTCSQLVAERAAIQETTSFYNCCGLSKLEVLKTRAIVRILDEKPRPPASSLEALSRAWYMASTMSTADVQRREPTAVFRAFGRKVDALMDVEDVTHTDLAAISGEFSKHSADKAYQPKLNDTQLNQLERLATRSAALTSLANQTLLSFESVAVQLGYVGSRTHLREITNDVSRPLGRLALCVVEPALLTGSNHKLGIADCVARV